MQPPGVPPPVHGGQLVVTPQWVQRTPAVPVNPIEYARPEQQMMHGDSGRHLSQYPGLETTQPASVGRESHMDPRAYTAQHASQHAGQSMADNSHYLQPVTQQGTVHQQQHGHRQVYPEVAPAHSYSVAGSATQLNHFSTSQTSLSTQGGQLLQPQALHHAQANQYASSQLYQQVPVQYAGQSGVQTGFDVCFSQIVVLFCMRPTQRIDVRHDTRVAAF